MKKLFKKMSAFLLTAAMVAGLSLTSYASSTASEDAPTITVGEGSTATIHVGVSSSEDKSQRANGGDILLAYKVVDITYNASSNTLAYNFTELFKEFIDNEQGSAWSSLTPESYGELGQDSLKTLLGAFTAYIRNQDPKPEATYKKAAGSDGVAVFESVAMGQYIIVGDGSSTGAKIYQTVTAEVQPVIVDDVYKLYSDYNVAMKTTTPSISKNIKDGTTTDEGIKTENQSVDGKGDKHDKHQGTAEIGTEITYDLKVNVPTYPEGSTNRTFYVGDTLSKGLTLVQNEGTAVTVTGYLGADDETGVELTKPEAYTEAIKVNDKEGEDGTTVLYIDFDFDEIAMYDHVVIEYKAALNSDASLGTVTGNPNDVDLIYSNTPFEGNTWKPGEGGDRPGPGEGFGQDEDMEIVYTYALVIDKFEEKQEGEKLAGATFELYRTWDGTAYSDPVLGEDGNVVTLTTDENGAAAFKGLHKGTYYLKETVAPTGYNLMDDAVVITIDANIIPYYIETEKEVNHYKYTITASDAIVDGQAKINGDLVWINEAGEVKTTDPTAGAPEGFSPAYVKEHTKTVENVIEVNRDAEGANGYYRAGVSNNTGAHLPSTGGMGTTIFTVVGICLMLGAAIVLIARRRTAGRQ